MPSPIRVLYADDNAHVDFRPVEGGIRRALNHIHASLSLKFESIDDLETALETLADPHESFDLTLLDINWKSLFDGEVLDASTALLQRSLGRMETATVLVSVNGKALLEKYYDQNAGALRPHAVMHKATISASEMSTAGMIEAAFSAALIRLRSRVVDCSWIGQSYFEMGLVSVPQIVAEELICSVLPGLVSVEIEPVGGGLSGALTALVRCNGNQLDGSPFRRSLFVKIDHDAARILREMTAHKSLVKQLPANTFAGLESERPVSYGRWFAVALDAADARPLATATESHFSKDLWSRIFSTSLLARTVELGEVRVECPADFYLSESGPLPETRVKRLLEAANGLGFGDRLQGEGDLRSCFSSVPRPIARSLVHGDLHQRNVLVGEEGQIYLVDAASMERWSFWPSDVARFAVWLVLESLEEKVCETEDVVQALVLDEDSGSWAAEVSACITDTLAKWEAAWNGAGYSVDVRADWRDAVYCELMRAVYSSQSFSRPVREAAMLIVAEAIDGVRPT